ncbi:hypothetical protein CR513_22262, partial [Mucuna pruriens]
MLGIELDFLCHRLSITLGARSRRPTKEETSKLLATHFIRKVQYPSWFTNMVMVKKSIGKWRMRTDYTYLNKACPKDTYPLPNID